MYIHQNIVQLYMYSDRFIWDTRKVLKLT